jgi:iron complex outermembrane recepter protein
MNKEIRFCRAVSLGLSLAVCVSTSFAQTSSDPAVLKNMSMQDLMNIEVTLVSKAPERLSASPSAIQVLTGEDIKRSGVTNIADALRLLPNVEVQQINSYAWVVSTRGFDALFANKLLVMIDGRSVYTPLDAGVFWDAQNVLLEDVERIEVVSGPGGTLWGANAVNGVINIVTRNSKDTTGAYASISGGSFLKASSGARYGNKIGDNLSYRIYGQYFNRNSTRTPTGGDGMNEWDMAEGGFRMDYRSAGKDALMLQGNGYNGTEHNSPTGDSTLNGQNLLGRWTRTSSRDSDFSLQVYFDRTGRRDIPSTITDRLSTYDIDFQDRFPMGKRHELLWGAGYRLMSNDTPTSTTFVGFVPQHRNMQLFSSFVQDEITLIPRKLKVSVGTKLEHNDFSGFEVQPSVRVAWTPTERQTIWAALSRAVRSPSRVDVDYHIPVTPPYAIGGGPDFGSEKVVAYEAGYRVQPLQKVSISVATFYNAYRDIYNVESANPPVLFPYTIQNGINGQSFGAELSAAYQPANWLRLRGGYTAFHKDLWVKPGHVTTAAVLASLGNDPEHQFVLQSMTDLPWHLQANGTFRHVSSLPNPAVSSYFTADVQLSRQFNSLEVSLVGRNLLESRHPEYNPPQQVPRSVYGQIAWRSKS